MSDRERMLVLRRESMGDLAAALRPLVGRLLRWELESDGVRREFVGRMARTSEWPAPEDPCLLVAPGQTNLTNVLAFIALHLRWRDSSAFLVRRRSYEEEPLEWEPLGPGPIRLTIRVLEE